MSDSYQDKKDKHKGSSCVYPWEQEDEEDDWDDEEEENDDADPLEDFHEKLWSGRCGFSDEKDYDRDSQEKEQEKADRGDDPSGQEYAEDEYGRPRQNISPEAYFLMKIFFGF